MMSIDNEQIFEELLEFIMRNFMVERDEIIFDDSLIDQGIIDSFGLVEINAFIQKEYSVFTTEDQLNRDNFGSLIKIANFVSREIGNTKE